MTLTTHLTSTEYWKVQLEAEINRDGELEIFSAVSTDHWVDDTNCNVPVDQISEEDMQGIYEEVAKYQGVSYQEMRYSI